MTNRTCRDVIRKPLQPEPIQYTFDQVTLGRRSKTDSVVAVSDLHPRVFDRQGIKEGVHHVVVNWIHWEKRKLERLYKTY